MSVIRMSLSEGAVVIVCVTPEEPVCACPANEKMGLEPISTEGVPSPMACGTVKTRPSAKAQPSESINCRFFICFSKVV